MPNIKMSTTNGLSAAGICLLVFACACSPQTRPSSTAALETENVLICAVELEFPDALSRERFLVRNVSEIASGVRSQALHVAAADDARRLTLYADASRCDSGQIRSFGLSWNGEARPRFSYVEPRVAIDHLAALFQPREETSVRSCIIRWSTSRYEVVGELYTLLPYTGLRRVQVEAADGNVYLATDEACGLTERFTREVVGQALDFSICEQRSLQACGYPNQITFD